MYHLVCVTHALPLNLNNNVTTALSIFYTAYTTFKKAL